MRIVVYSPAFHPLIGGLEEVARLCCLEFQREGHEVVVLTDTPLGNHSELPFRVIRRFSFSEAFEVTRSSDVFVEFNISLKGMVFPLLARKPLVISHQSWFSDIRRPPTWRACLKRFATRLASNVACSQAVKEYLGVSAEVIPNAYDEQTFQIIPGIPRDRELLFVGRLVSDKGCSVLLEALGLLKKEGISPSLTITGSGPEQELLARQAAVLGLADQIRFTGPLRGHQLAREMNRHRTLVVPSLWAEPFGIVALEGIACGCYVIGSNAGGLRDAIGLCGCTFPNGDVSALCAILRNHTGIRAVEDHVARVHLMRHTSHAVGLSYLEVIQRTTKRRINRQRAS